MKNYIFLALSMFLLLGCSSTSSNPDSGKDTGKNPVTGAETAGQLSQELVGKWRSYSDLTSTRVLELNADGKWQLGSSSGTWTVDQILQEDWSKWGMSSYGPGKKIILYGWNNGVADGPIEESGAGVDFLWVIYNVTLDIYGEPRQAQIKYGHANWD